MPWVRAKFRDQEVWAEVDAEGEAVVQQGRVRIRYSDSPNAKTYPAARRNVVLGAAGAEAPKPRRRGSSPAPRSRSPAPAAVPGAAICFTDGACRGNPGPAGAGVYVEFPDGRRLRLAADLGQGTNNIAELTAIILGIERLEEAGWLPGEPVRVLTDSSYSIGVLQSGWKAKANQELVRRARNKLAAHPTVRLEKVAGHAGIPGNEEADRLANAGVDGASFVEWDED
jgi:ribonuclease HI